MVIAVGGYDLAHFSKQLRLVPAMLGKLTLLAYPVLYCINKVLYVFSLGPCYRSFHFPPVPELIVIVVLEPIPRPDKLRRLLFGRFWWATTDKGLIGFILFHPFVE